MPNAKDINLAKHPLNILVYGRQGTGKSVFSGTFPKPLLMDFDDGALVHAGHDLQYESYPMEAGNYVKLWARFKKEFSAYLPRIKSGEFETVIIDSLTSLSSVIFEKTLEGNRSTSKTPGKATQQDYGEAINLMDGFLNELKALKFYGAHVICIAHEEAKADKDGDVISIRPLMTGRVAGDNVGSKFDEVYRSYVTKNGDYVLQTKTIGLAEAKSRFDAPLQRAGLPGIPKAMVPDYETLQVFAAQVAALKTQGATEAQTQPVEA